MKLHNLIYARAEERGIKIECGPKHRTTDDYTGAGRRRVVFPGGRCYDYRGTLGQIGLRLGLISDEEFRTL